MPLINKIPRYLNSFVWGNNSHPKLRESNPPFSSRKSQPQMGTCWFSFELLNIKLQTAAVHAGIINTTNKIVDKKKMETLAVQQNMFVLRMRTQFWLRSNRDRMARSHGLGVSYPCSVPHRTSQGTMVKISLPSTLEKTMLTKRTNSPNLKKSSTALESMTALFTIYSN